MTTISLILFSLSTAGLATVIVESPLLASFRAAVKSAARLLGWPTLGEVVDCHLCAGTWAGFAMAAVWLTSNPIEIVAAGFAGGLVARLTPMLLNLIDSATVALLRDEETLE